MRISVFWNVSRLVVNITTLKNVMYLQVFTKVNAINTWVEYWVSRGCRRLEPAEDAGLSSSTFKQQQQTLPIVSIYRTTELMGK